MTKVIGTHDSFIDVLKLGMLLKAYILLLLMKLLMILLILKINSLFISILFLKLKIIVFDKKVDIGCDPKCYG